MSLAEYKYWKNPFSCLEAGIGRYFVWFANLFSKIIIVGTIYNYYLPTWWLFSILLCTLCEDIIRESCIGYWTDWHCYIHGANNLGITVLFFSNLSDLWLTLRKFSTYCSTNTAPSEGLSWNCTCGKWDGATCHLCRPCIHFPSHFFLAFPSTLSLFLSFLSFSFSLIFSLPLLSISCLSLPPFFF